MSKGVKIKFILCGSIVFASLMFGSISLIARDSIDVECLEANGECERIKLGEEVHIFPGIKKEVNQQ